MGEDEYLVRYDKTVPMPTYLVAFVISDYQIDTVQGFSPITNTEVRTGIAEESSGHFFNTTSN